METIRRVSIRKYLSLSITKARFSFTSVRQILIRTREVFKLQISHHSSHFVVLYSQYLLKSVTNSSQKVIKILCSTSFFYSSVQEMVHSCDICKHATLADTSNCYIHADALLKIRYKIQLTAIKRSFCFVGSTC